MKSVPSKESYYESRPKKGYRGVFKCGRKFKAQIQVHGIQTYLGLFDDAIEAAKAYDDHARVHLGLRAKLNFPNRQDPKLNALVLESFEKPRSKKRIYVGVKRSLTTLPVGLPAAIATVVHEDSDVFEKKLQKTDSIDEWVECLHLVEDLTEDEPEWTTESIDGNTFVW